MAQQNMTLEMATWIVEHGSEYLKALAKNGYPVLRQYIKERAAMEYPGFTPDFDRMATWRELCEHNPSPTVEQIALAQKYGGQAVLFVRNTNGRICLDTRVAVVIAENPFGVPLVEADKNY